MSINAITGSGNNTVSSSAQSNKSTEPNASSETTKSTSINYSTASDADLETLAAQGDIRAQNELAKRKATEEAESKSNSTGDTSFHVEA